MSFDVIVTVMTDGDVFERAIVERAFAAFASNWDDLWQLAPDGKESMADVYIDPGPDITCFVVNRPPNNKTFWNAVVEVLRVTPTALVWPAPRNPAYCVARSDWESFVPLDYIETFGKPVVVASGDEIDPLIEPSGVYGPPASGAQPS